LLLGSFRITSKAAAANWSGSYSDGTGHWTGTIYYAFDDSGKKAWTDAEKRVVREAVKEYRDIGIRFQEVIPEFDHNIALTWQDLSKQTNESPLPLAWTKFDGSGGSPNAIEFNTNLSYGSWFVDSNPTIDNPIPSGQFDLLTVAKHELGHSLGLEHVEVYSVSMYPFVSPGTRRRVAPGDMILLADLYTIATPTATITLTETITPTASITPTPTLTPTDTPTDTELPPNYMIINLYGSPMVVTKTPTATPTFTPAKTSLRGTVQQRSNARYGPGAAFLYKYGLAAGTTMEVIGRDVDGGWVVVQAIGGHNPAWINANLIQIDGDVMSLPVVDPDSLLTISHFLGYGPPAITDTSINGDQVTLSWAPVTLRIDQYPGPGIPIYLVEIWTCNQGKQTFAVIGTNDTTVTFPIDNSCGQSRAEVRLQFKEGFTTADLIPLSK
jgi:hypothetical protein